MPTAVPFDEDDRDKTVWFLDHDYLEHMAAMFKKVNGKTLCFLNSHLQHAMSCIFSFKILVF